MKLGENTELSDYETIDQNLDTTLRNHGYMTWLVWTPLSLVILASGRYAKGSTKWKLLASLHNIIGLFIFLVTLASCLHVYHAFGWKQTLNIHSIAGLIALATAGLVTLTGIMTVILMRRDKITKAPWMITLHKVLGYGIIICSNLIVTGGILTYQKKYAPDEKRYVLAAILNLLVFITIVIVLERYHRKKDPAHIDTSQLKKFKQSEIE